MLRQQSTWNTASRWAAGPLAACALLAAVARFSAAADDAKPGGEAQTKPRTDLYGDPLPTGALARLGAVRWRHGGPITYAAFTADGKALLTASQDDTIRLWDMRTGKEIRRFGKPQAVELKGGGDPTAARMREALLAMRLRMRGFPGGGPNVTLAPDGKTLASMTQPDAVQLWDVATGKELRQLKVPPFSAGGLIFSRDGKVLASRGNDRTIRLWEVSTGKELRQIAAKQNMPGGVVVLAAGFYGTAGLAFSPNGKLLAAPESVFNNGKVSTFVPIWDAETGKEIRRIEMNGAAGIFTLAFSPDSKALACGNNTGITLYAADTGKEIRQVEGGQATATVVFSPDGKALATAAMGTSRVRLCSVETGKVLRELGEEEAPAGPGNVRLFMGGTPGQAVAFSPDGKLVAVGGGNTVRVWEADTGKQVVQVKGHREEVTALAVSPDGKLIASKGADNTVRLWEASTGKQRHEFRAPAGTTCVAFAPDARTVALGNGDSTVRLHEVATGKELRRLQGHRNGVVAVAFALDGKTIASRGGSDNTIRLYEAATGKELRVISRGGADNPANPGAVFVVNGGRFGGGRIGLAFSPNGKTLATPSGTAGPAVWAPGGAPGAPENAIDLWDVATGKKVHKIALPQQYAVVSFAFSPDGRVLATENADQTITLWEIASGRERARFGKAPEMKGPAPGMQVMIAGGFSPFGSASASPTVAFAPDGRSLASRGPDQALQVWDVATGKEIGRLKGHAASVSAVAFSPDGKTLISGSGDTTVLVWDAMRVRPAPVARTGQMQPAELEAVWTDLADADGIKAFHGIQKLAAAPAQAIPFLRERLKPVAPVDAEKLRQKVADLSAKRFAERQRAMNELEKLGELAVPALNEALKNEPPLETRKRVEQLLERLTGGALSGDRLRVARAVEVLEDLGTTEARRVLETLGGGAAGALPTREARAALERLARRPSTTP